MDCVEALSFAILINGTPMEFFLFSVGLHQDYSLSHYLFILCVDALSWALRAATQGLVPEPYWSAPNAQSLSHLLFTDDYLLIDWASIQNAEYFAAIVEAYCQASGQMVNLQKSAITVNPRTKP
ncbi:uncharacterized mitochondrial protein AtMg01250-like [Elaeis guineensis]|uniref:uncharacterized mitochondrial protein AtMg01250-like n=1 Tax=Elaeis guineensis var. tenera TaxID=51953 RepID=UPI003C6DA6AE